MNTQTGKPWWQDVIEICSQCESYFTIKDAYYGWRELCDDCLSEYEPTDAELIS